MATPKIMVARGLTALREAAYLTDAGISTSHGLEFVEAEITPQDRYDGDRSDVHHGTGGELSPTESAGRTYSIRLRGELKGKGSAYSDAIADERLYHVMLGCGLSGVVAGDAITVTPVRPDNAGSFTLGFYTADAFHKIVGCRGSLTFSMSHAQRGFWEFNGQGVQETSYPTETALPSITYTNQSQTPPVYTNASPVLGSWNPVVDSIQFEIANEVAERGNDSATGTHAGFVLTNRRVNWSFPGEAVDLSTYDPFSTSLSGTTATLSGTLGSATGKTWNFSAAKASVRPPEYTDESGRVLYNLSGRCHITSGNDEIAIKLA